MFSGPFSSSMSKVQDLINHCTCVFLNDKDVGQFNQFTTFRYQTDAFDVID